MKSVYNDDIESESLEYAAARDQILDQSRQYKTATLVNMRV